MATGIAWASIQDVEDLIGPVEDIDRGQRLLERATGIVAGYICWPLVVMPLDEVAAPVREAVATLAARALTGTVGGGGVASETIGGYSYRLTPAGSATDAMRITPDIATLLSGYRCGGGSASVSVCTSCGSASCSCCLPPVGASYAYSGPKRPTYADYLQAPYNEVGTPYNSLLPGRWWRETERNVWHDGVTRLPHGRA